MAILLKLFQESIDNSFKRSQKKQETIKHCRYHLSQLGSMFQGLLKKKLDW